MSALPSTIHAYNSTQASASFPPSSSPGRGTQEQASPPPPVASRGHNDNDEEQRPFSRFLPADPTPDQKGLMKTQLWNTVVLMGINIGIPLAIYYSIRDDMDIVYALLISGIPPLAYVIYTFYRERRVDMLGCIICLSFILSAVVSIITGDARIILLRDGAVTAVMGFLFLITLIPLKTRWFTIRPMVLLVGRQLFRPTKYRWTDREGQRQEMLVSEWQWQELKVFRWSMYGLTAAWGVLLILEFVATVIMVYVASNFSVDAIVKYNNIINGVVVAVMITATIICLVFIRRAEIRVGHKWAEANDYTDKY